GIGVVLEERRDEPLARNDRPVEEHLARRGDLVRDEQVQITEASREEQAVPERADADAALPAEVRRLAAAVGPVELVLRGVDDDVIARELAEVDARLVDLRLTDRRDVLHREERAAVRSDRADRRGDGTEAMRE